jgi:hypothetical protein
MSTPTDLLAAEAIEEAALPGAPGSDLSGISWESIHLATSNAQHGETVTQSRLNNFLFAVSILLLAWATLYDRAQAGSGRTIALIGVALLSAFLSIIWLILGTRQQKFAELNWDLVAREEARLPRDRRVGWFIWRMQYRNPIFLESGKQVRLNHVEWVVNSRSLLVIAPVAFLVVSLLFVWASVA